MEFSCEWNDKYSTGFENVDEQHKMIFKLANSITSQNTQEEIASSVLALYKYTRKHFCDEEYIMEQINYPELKSHQEMHNKLIDDLNEISGTQLRKNDSIEEFKIFIIRWVIEHIMVHDKKFISFLRK